MRKAIAAGLLAVLALAPSAPASAAPLSLASGEQVKFFVQKGDSVRLLVDGDDAVVEVRNRGDLVDSFSVHCGASRPRFQLSHQRLTYRLQCDQRKK